MTVKNRNENRTIFERESKKGNKHLVVRTTKRKEAPGKKFDDSMRKAAKRFKL